MWLLQRLGRTHPPAVDGLSEQRDDVLPFAAAGLEALGPLQQDALGQRSVRLT